MYAIVDAISDLLGRCKRRFKRLLTSRNSPSDLVILCLLQESPDQSLIAETCRDHQWNVHFATDLDHAQRLLKRVDFQIVLLDRDLAGEKWRDAMTRLVAPSGALCILLVSKVFDDYLWNEVVRNGGYDVLAKPLRQPDVARAVKLARSYWLSANSRAATSPRA